MDELKCPSCSYPVGDPVRPGRPLDKRIPISDKDLMICIKCFEVMRGTNAGALRVLTAKERTYVILFKPDFMRMLKIAWMAAEPVKNANN